MRNRILTGALLCLAGVTLLAQTDLGPPRWMPVNPMSGSRRTADDLAAEKHLLALVDRFKSLSILNPVPGVYPQASLSSNGTPAPAPYGASLMLGFWPPKDTRLTSGVLRPAGELAHLMIYMNWVREEAMDKTYWKDAEGSFYPQPQQLGDVQGFPVYEGFGSSELSGILIIQPPGRQLFTPVSRKRFHGFAVADLEKKLQSAMGALKSAQAKYAASTSAEGATAREKQIVASLEQYRTARPRTPEQMTYREQEVRRLDAEEIERQRLDAALDTNRLTGPLTVALTAAKASLAALTPDEQSSPACHLPDARDIGPHPVATGSGCRPIVSMTRWYNPALPRTTPQLLSIERYWLSARETKTFGDAVRPYYRLNAASVEALDWKQISTTFLK